MIWNLKEKERERERGKKEIEYPLEKQLQLLHFNPLTNIPHLWHSTQNLTKHKKKFVLKEIQKKSFFCLQ